MLIVSCELWDCACVLKKLGKDFMNCVSTIYSIYDFEYISFMYLFLEILLSQTVCRNSEYCMCCILSFRYRFLILIVCMHYDIYAYIVQSNWFESNNNLQIHSKCSQHICNLYACAAYELIWINEAKQWIHDFSQLYELYVHCTYMYR